MMAVHDIKELQSLMVPIDPHPVDFRDFKAFVGRVNDFLASSGQMV